MLIGACTPMFCLLHVFSEPVASLVYNDFDIVLNHFSRQFHSSVPPDTRRAFCTLCVLNRVLTGACDYLMLCPIHVFNNNNSTLFVLDHFWLI